MAKGENIFLCLDGRWEARYRKGYTPAGKIRYGYCYGKTYAEAKEKVNRCKAALAAGCPPPANGRNRFSWYCGQWLESKRGTVGGRYSRPPADPGADTGTLPGRAG